MVSLEMRFMKMQGGRLEVVQVDEAVLGDEVDDAVLLGDLHSDGESR